MSACLIPECRFAPSVHGFCPDHAAATDPGLWGDYLRARHAAMVARVEPVVPENYCELRDEFKGLLGAVIEAHGGNPLL